MLSTLGLQELALVLEVKGSAVRGCPVRGPAGATPFHHSRRRL